MARTYFIDGPTTHGDGDPLDAWTARTRVQKNPEALYEEARDDGRVVLGAYYEITSQIVPWGPVPIRMRRDRNGLWRTQYVDILYAPGGLDGKPVWAVITDTYRRPTTTTPLGTPTGRDPYTSWSPATGTTPAWLGAQAITLPRDWSPSIIARGSEATRGTMRIGWLTVWCMDTPTGSNPRFAGYRHYESVADEP